MAFQKKSVFLSQNRKILIMIKAKNIYSFSKNRLTNEILKSPTRSSFPP